MKWRTVIGLEVHVQLLTKSKLFSGSACKFGAPPNTQTCAIDLAMPGVMPVLNTAVLDMAIKFGLAINATISNNSKFARKNYFYPDLPKGYQITQHTSPIIMDGYLDITTQDQTIKRVNITRAHLEEDAGKSLHNIDEYNNTGIDLNRAGNPLLEIVSAPELSSPQEAVNYLKTLHTLVCYLDICDGNMQEGSLRCDANISVCPVDSAVLGTRVEIKNINSFRFVEQALEYEITRQTTLLEAGGIVEQETRLYDTQLGITKTMRSKENALDYRYFTEPDLMPIVITPAMLEQAQAALPELPAAKRARFMTDYQLSSYDTEILSSDKALAQYFEYIVVNHPELPSKLVANWIIVELLGALNKHNLDITNAPITPATLGALLEKIVDNTISGKIAKTVFEILWQEGGSVAEIIKKLGLTQITDDQTINNIISNTLSTESAKIAEYRNGKTKLFAYFIGKVMQASQGKINPQRLNALLEQYLTES